MEIFIIICLLIVIALLLADKKLIRKKSSEKVVQEKVNMDIPTIMGQPRQIVNFSVLGRTFGNLQNVNVTSKNLDAEIIENKETDIQIPFEELDGVFDTQPDFDEEEEEWKQYGIFVEDHDLAYCVTFEELSHAGKVLKKEELSSFQKNTTFSTVQKIQGTILFDLLEKSIEKGAVKIANLLDTSLSSIASDSNSKNFPKADVEGFDIEKFI